MEALFIYILKASGVLVLFYTAYELLLKKETFFHVNRAFLLLGLLAALILPSIVIKDYVVMDPLNSGTVALQTIESNPNTQPISGHIDWMLLGKLLFLTGFVIMGVRFLLQLLSIRKLIRTHRLIRVPGYTLVEINKDLAPFSFFNYIFYHPGQYDPEELEAILEHEKVHCHQWHSLDVLLAQAMLVFLWINPISWLYFRNIQQNLEFLADSSATDRVASQRNYEYTMLKISGNLKVIPVTNNFYNSLIKKRIVMLHQSKSKKRNALKTLLIIPILALFLWSFNSETIYLPSENEKQEELYDGAEQRMIEIQIDKDTSNEELKELKKDLSDKGIDFSYTVVHNEQDEIIDLSITVSSDEKEGKRFVGSSTFNNDGSPIDPVTIVFDEDKQMFFLGKNNEDIRVIQTEENYTSWVHADEDAHQSIEIYKDDGVEVIRVNGKEISREELEKMEKEGKLHKEHIKIEKKMHNGEGHRIMIMGDHDEDHDIEVIHGDQTGFLFLNGEVDDNWLILLDGKEVKMEDVKNLDPDEVETVNVIKGEAAVKKYGKKAKKGVLVITTIK